MGNNPAPPPGIRRAECFAELKQHVAELNGMITVLEGKGHETARFELIPTNESDVPIQMLWKTFAKVLVQKKEKPKKQGDKERVSTQRLDYGQFYLLYARFQARLEKEKDKEAAEGKEKENETAKKKTEEVDDSECIICMEHFAQIVLPCNHAFCQTCISDWNMRKGTCPLCREAIGQQINECWVLTGSPPKHPTHSMDSLYHGAGELYEN